METCACIFELARVRAGISDMIELHIVVQTFFAEPDSANRKVPARGESGKSIERDAAAVIGAVAQQHHRADSNAPASDAS